MSINSYEKILDNLSRIVERDDITPECRREISYEMIKIADKIAAKDIEDKNFKKTVMEIGEKIVTCMVFAVIGGLGAKYVMSSGGDNARDIL